MTSLLPDARVLARFDVLSKTSQDTRAALARAAHVQVWQAGQMIFQRGDADDRLLAITSGRVRVSVTTQGGRELVLKVLGKWQILGEFALLDGLPRSADAIAIETSSAIIITRERFLQVASTQSDLPLAFARYLCALLRTTNFQMESIALYDVQSRLIRFVLQAVAQAHGDDPPAFARIDLGLSQTNLAAALGATRPRVNNALQDLLAKGALARDGSALICNLALLHQIAAAAEVGA